MRLTLTIVLAVAGCTHQAQIQVDTIPLQDSFVQPVRPPEPLSEGVHNGMIQQGDDTDDAGRFSDTYVVTLESGQRVRVWLLAEMFDTMLRVRGPGEIELDNDDFLPGTLNSLVEFTAPEAGEYLIQVTSFGPGQMGPYDVGLQTLNPSAGPTLEGDADQTMAISPNGAGPGVAMGASYWLRVDSGSRVRVRVTSPGFDTTAAIFAPGGEVWMNDDAGDTGPNGTERPLDSTLTLVAPEAGLYHLIVAPFGGMGEGSFRVQTTSRPPVVLAPGEQVPSVGFAGRQGEGRILGLFAGIADYPSGGDLYACDDDASLLAQAFRERGLQSDEQQIVLTNLNANRAAVTAGLQRLAAESTAQDVVVIFYSGHGGSIAVTETDQADIDGTDETIVLVDGPMIDNEVVALIDQITADVIILAMDSCHSGGFARDFMTRPNRIGLFSSDEDVLSDTAEPLLAGGYLSYMMRRAVIGEADFMPSDGALFAGELTDFLHLGFVQQNQSINPSGSTSPMQWLVSRRGSITWNEPLWLYPRGSDGEMLPIPEVELNSAPPVRSH